MLIQAFRDYIPKWVFGVILALLTIPFALWGIDSYFTASTDNSVATVNGDPISNGDYQRQYQNQYAQYERVYGAAFKPEMIDEKKLHQQVLDALIDQTLLKQQIDKQHYSISDAQLIDAVEKMPMFQVGGKFSPQVYRAALTESGVTVPQFEAGKRQDILFSQIEGAIRDSAIASTAELAAAVAVRQQQREIGYLEVPAKRFLAGIQVSDADVQAYYGQHKAEFMTPETVSLDYVDLDEANLAKQAEPSDADLQALYQQQIDSYKQSEVRTARHILIAVNGDDPKVDAAAKAKAEDVLKQIQAGGDFAKLAEKYSDDTASAKQGGELGQITRGEMVPPFENALFALQRPNDIAGPVRSKYGYHIIQLETIKAATVQPFAAVRSQLLADYQKKKAEDEYYSLGDQLANLAYEHPQSLDEVSKQLNLPIQSVEGVTADAGTGIGANADVRKAAFSTQVLSQGSNSEPIQLAPTHAVVIRVKGHVPSEAKPLAQVRDQILASLKQQRASDAAAKLAQTLMSELAKGGDAAALAKANGATYTAPVFMARDQKGVPQAILDQGFAAAQPAAGARTTELVAMQGGDQAVLLLTAVKPGDLGGMDQQHKLAGLNDLSQQDGAGEFAAYIAYLRKNAKIDINSKNLDQSSQD